MSLKQLRKAVVAGLRTHTSHSGRTPADLYEEFDREMPRFNRFCIVDNEVALKISILFLVEFIYSC